MAIIEKIAQVISIGFLALFCYLYTSFVINIGQLNQHSTAMNLNMVIPMSAGIVGGVLMLFHSVSLIILPKSIRQ